MSVSSHPAGGWERPSSRVASLLQSGAELVLNVPEETIDEIDAAAFAALPDEVAQDPSLAGAVRRTNRAYLYAWARANVSDPGAEVPSSLGAEGLTLARDLVRRGLDDTALQAYRVGQNVAWRKWMEIAFTLTDDAAELRELLDVSARSIHAFVDTTMRQLAKQIQTERDELTRGTHTERLEIVSLIINGVSVTRERTVTRLGYELEQHHTAAVIWSDEPEPAADALGQVADAIIRDAGAPRPLVVIASAAALWMWIPGAVQLRGLEAAVAGHPGVRVAVGPSAAGTDGFRRSHLNAIATQRLMIRASSKPRVATYDAIELVALLSHDEEGSAQFIKRTLGALEQASPELRETLRVYLAEQSNAQRAATRLSTHRNTIFYRIAHAERLLPRPLRDNSIAVAAALEMMRWG